MLNSVEVLNVEFSDYWILVHLPAVSPRESPVFCPISETQIVIIGGYDNKHLSDVILLDSKTLIAESVIADAGIKILSCNK